MSDLPKWFSNPIKTMDLFRRDYYVCTNCGGQSCGGIYSSVCPKCNGIQSDPPRNARSEYFCNSCALPPICKCDYPVIRIPPTPSPSPPRPRTPDPCCCNCNWCNFLCRCVCCCVKCTLRTSNCKNCCTSAWNCYCCKCSWTWCGCSNSEQPE